MPIPDPIRIIQPHTRTQHQHTHARQAKQWTEWRTHQRMAGDGNCARVPVRTQRHRARATLLIECGEYGLCHENIFPPGFTLSPERMVAHGGACACHTLSEKQSACECTIIIHSIGFDMSALCSLGYAVR